jgi:gluconolactonase
MAETVDDILDAKEPERLATGFVFTEGPLWHPDGYLDFVDIRRSQLFRLAPGKEPELIREDTGEGNGTTLDLEGNVVMCEMARRRVVRLRSDGGVDVLAERYEGKRLNRPNDVICRSDGTLLFTDPGMRTPLAERELPYSGVYRLTPDGDLALVADCEYPNGLAFSPDESTLYVANSRWAQYIHALTLDGGGRMVRRRIFADMSTDDEPTDAEALYRGTAGNLGVPDGMKVDSAGRVFCTGRGGVWVFDPSGERIGIIPMPEVCANLAFGGADLCTLFLTASASVYSLRVKAPRRPHPYQAAH